MLDKIATYPTEVFCTPLPVKERKKKEERKRKEKRKKEHVNRNRTLTGRQTLVDWDDEYKYFKIKLDFLVFHLVH